MLWSTTILSILIATFVHFFNVESHIFFLTYLRVFLFAMLKLGHLFSRLEILKTSNISPLVETKGSEARISWKIKHMKKSCWIEKHMNKDLIVKSISIFGFVGYDMPEKENIISPFSQFILHTLTRTRAHAQRHKLNWDL